MNAQLSIDSEAVLWSAPPAERAGRPLLLLLHGYNSNESDLFALAPYLPLQPVIASLRAPLPVGPGSAWFPLEITAAGMTAGSAGESVTAILNWLDTLSPAPTGVGVLGFSQGAATAIELLRTAPQRFDFAVALAGFVLPGQRDADAELARISPPLFWGRGTRDGVIPADAIGYAEEWLPRYVAVETRVYEDVAHTISEQELSDIVAFTAARYPKPTSQS